MERFQRITAIPHCLPQTAALSRQQQKHVGSNYMNKMLQKMQPSIERGEHSSRVLAVNLFSYLKLEFTKVSIGDVRGIWGPRPQTNYFMRHSD